MRQIDQVDNYDHYVSAAYEVVPMASVSNPFISLRVDSPQAVWRI